MQQYFVSQILAINDKIEMNKEQSHHIMNVMRMREQEKIRLCDPEGHMFFATVSFEGRHVYSYVVEGIIDHTHNNVRIILAQGLIKGEKWDYTLQKSAELGVDEILPFVSKRCVVKTKDDKIEKKLERWNKILLEGCEQCKRSSLVKLHTPCDFKQLIDVKADLKLIAYENADISSKSLHQTLLKHKHLKTILIVIGCEGGFDVDEVTYLEQHDFIRVSLGARILRAETAALSLVSNIAFYYEMQGETT